MRTEWQVHNGWLTVRQHSPYGRYIRAIRIYWPSRACVAAALRLARRKLRDARLSN